MKYRTMGKLGIQSSAFGLGCMRFNGAASGDSTIDEQKAVSLIRLAIDGGVNYIDTAYVYLDKTSEIVLGKALLDGYREKVTIATKVPPDMVNSRADMERILERMLAGKLVSAKASAEISDTDSGIWRESRFSQLSKA